MLWVIRRVLPEAEMRMSPRAIRRIAPWAKEVIAQGHKEDATRDKEEGGDKEDTTWGKNKGGEALIMEEVLKEGEGGSSTPHFLLTTISRGETLPLDLGLSGEQVSIPFPFPSFFGVDVEPSLLEKGAPLDGLVSECISYANLAYDNAFCHTRSLGETPAIGAGSVALSLEAFFLGPRYVLEARGMGRFWEVPPPPLPLPKVKLLATWPTCLDIFSLGYLWFSFSLLFALLWFHVCRALMT